MSANVEEQKLNWERIFSLAVRVSVWGLFFLVLFLLRSFFLLIFLTFVFAYILSSAESRLGKYFGNRTLRVVISASMLLGILLIVGAFILPRVKEQTLIFIERFPLYMQTLDGHLFHLSESYPILKNVIPDSTAMSENPSLMQSPSAQLLRDLLGSESGEMRMSATFGAARQMGAYAMTVVSAFLLSLLFSFLIVLDLPQLTGGVKSLQQTKLRFVYDEVADSIRDFGKVMGKALEAQVFIALLNTVFTAFGLVLLGITDKITFISMIVFLCSFVPVAGVFISSVPICLLALQQGGVSQVLLSIGMICVVHMIEAYILNPRIYGYHLRMNPVIVLIILTIAGKMFHVWGLILGVPVANYLYGHAIRYKHDSKSEEVAAH